jgi:hypothetical protein
LEYVLRTFGIICEKALQAERVDGDDQRELVREYLNRRWEIDRVETKAVEQEEVKSGVIPYPKPNDVLMGRGLPFRDFHGNQLWARLIDDNLERYQTCPDKFGKTCLSLEIIQTIQEHGGRFLQQTGEGWKVLDDAVARDKTLRAFRPRIAKYVGTASPAKRMKYDPKASG